MERDEVDEDDISSHHEPDPLPSSISHTEYGKDGRHHLDKSVSEGRDESVHPLHSHILLYSNPIDSRTLLHFLTVSLFILLKTYLAFFLYLTQEINPISHSIPVLKK